MYHIPIVSCTLCVSANVYGHTSHRAGLCKGGWVKTAYQHLKHMCVSAKWNGGNRFHGRISGPSFHLLGKVNVMQNGIYTSWTSWNCCAGWKIAFLPLLVYCIAISLVQDWLTLRRFQNRVRRIFQVNWINCWNKSSLFLDLFDIYFKPQSGMLSDCPQRAISAQPGRFAEWHHEAVLERMLHSLALKLTEKK